MEGAPDRFRFILERPRVSCRTTSSPAASAMATEASVLPPSTASTSAGGGSSAASERNTRGVEFTGYLLDFRRVCPGATPEIGAALRTPAPISSHKPLNWASAASFAGSGGLR